MIEIYASGGQSGLLYCVSIAEGRKKALTCPCGHHSSPHLEINTLQCWAFKARRLVLVEESGKELFLFSFA